MSSFCSWQIRGFAPPQNLTARQARRQAGGPLGYLQAAQVAAVEGGMERLLLGKFLGAACNIRVFSKKPSTGILGFRRGRHSDKGFYADNV